MRILITVDPELPVPPPKYGGVERLVDGLVTTYTQKGHEVFLLAHPDSKAAKAQKIFGWAAVHSRGFFNIVKNARKLYSIYNQVKPDVIHSFSRLLYTYPLLLTKKVAFLQTYGRYISPISTLLASFVGGKKMNFTAAARHMILHLKNTKKWHIVYNFTDVNYYKPDSSVKREYLMFLGRIEDIKGTYEAIEAAIKTGQKLIIAGNIEAEHREYFDEMVKPFVDKEQIQYVGAVNDEQKRRYLQRAKALLFPIKWEEPFGIVMIESMACGAPVIAFNRGSVPEVIQNGVNGFIVGSTLEMAEAIRNLDTIDYSIQHPFVVEKFSADVIADEYLKLLHQISGR